MKHFDYSLAKWGRNDKIKYRSDLIIDVYRAKYRRRAIPKGSQYWTMCGCHVLDDEVVDNTEYVQLTRSGLLLPSQFFGIDCDQSIIVNNARLIPAANWLHGDVVQAIVTFPSFRPAIVHLDTINMADGAVELLHKTMHCVECSSRSECMVVVNIVETDFLHHRPHTAEEIIGRIADSAVDHILQINNWTIGPEDGYYYSSSHSRMIAYILFFDRTLVPKPT